MKRIAVVGTSLALLVGALGTADAGQNRRVERTVTGIYQPYPTPVTACNTLTVTSGTWACLIVKTRPTEAVFTADVKDAHGLPVRVTVYSGGGEIASFCGKTDRPIAFRPGSSLEFDVGQGRLLFTSLPTCPQHIAKTTGTITVKLSNRR